MAKPRGNADYLRGYKSALVVVDKALREEFKRMDRQLQDDYGSSYQRMGYNRAYEAFLGVVKEAGAPGE